MGTRFKYVVEVNSRKGIIRMAQTFDSRVPTEKLSEKILRLFEETMAKGATVLACEVYDWEPI